VSPVRRAPLALLVLALAGCASAGKAWRAGPAGIPAERQLRTELASGRFGAAWVSLKDKKVAPADALLRNLYRGVVGLHAGELEEGARAMDRAWQQMDARFTKRVSDGAAALATGDGALPYLPGPAERLFVPYYGGLTWLARNEVRSAAVEARRLSAFLADERGPRPPADLQAVMRIAAGAMFERAGEWNDALVAYRNARALAGDAIPVDTLPMEGHGDVVILVEDGFVDRPEPASLVFWFTDDELAALDHDDEAVRIAAVHRMGARRHESRDWHAAHYRSVSLRWPQMDPGRHAASRVPLGARAGGVEGITLVADVSDAVRDDFDRAQPARIARAIARAAVREVTLDAAGGAFGRAAESAKGKGKETKDKDDDEKGSGWRVAGWIVVGLAALFAHAASEVLDQPDLRAWQLLPDRVAVTRLRLPAGEHTIEVVRGGEVHTLGRVTVREGRVSVLAHRWWPSGPRLLANAP
jgi:hypothetical protein